jgi:CRISPR type III-B/RAMP module-associated protein Cmr5
MLQVSGLGQTLAYLYGKGYEGGRPNFAKAEGRLLDQLGEYLRETQKRPPDRDPMDTLLSLNAAEYRDATREIAAVAEWLKRFAEGQLA